MLIVEDRNYFLNKIAKLEDVINKLPITKDNQRVVPGVDKVYYPANGKVYEQDVCMGGVVSPNEDAIRDGLYSERSESRDPQTDPWLISNNYATEDTARLIIAIQEHQATQQA